MLLVFVGVVLKKKSLLLFINKIKINLSLTLSLRQAALVDMKTI